MKKFLVAFSMMLAVLFTTNSAKAQIIDTGDPTVDLILGNLIAVDVEDINVNLVDVVDVNNVLNNTQVEILKNFVVDIEIDNVLNDLLRRSEIISRNQIVVGVLSNGTFLILDQKHDPKKK